MFANAYEIASQFTIPTILNTRTYKGEVKSAIGAFVVVNEEGWIITASHLVSDARKFDQDKQAYNEYLERISVIENDENLSDRQKTLRINRLRIDDNLITHYSYWWGHDAYKITEVSINPAMDLAAGKLSNYDPDAWEVEHYPVFKDPDRGMRIGVSLCKLGFPFHTINSDFDEDNSKFVLDPAALPIPRFPIEGIYTRNAEIRDNSGKDTGFKLIETSSPGLRGQSGGPIFDRNGVVWGIQSRTVHLPLGFSPEVIGVVEHQFLNVGLGVHPETVKNFLDELGINYSLSDY